MSNHPKSTRPQSTQGRRWRRSPTPPSPTAQRAQAERAAAQMARVFTPATGYNPRQRQATAYRLLAVVVHGYLLGQTLGFARLRAFFVKLYGPIRPRAFQLRFKQANAAKLFRAARRRLIETTTGW